MLLELLPEKPQNRSRFGCLTPEFLGKCAGDLGTVKYTSMVLYRQLSESLGSSEKESIRAMNLATGKLESFAISSR